MSAKISSLGTFVCGQLSQLLLNPGLQVLMPSAVGPLLLKLMILSHLRDYVETCIYLHSIYQGLM
jgi:hypothetical protein